MAVETLGEALNLSWRAYARCVREPNETMKRRPMCGYSYELDMETLVCTRGRDFPIGMLASRLRCPRCGWTRMRVAFSAPASDQRTRATNFR